MADSLIISLGGSLIVPDTIDAQYLADFRRLILAHLDRYTQVMIVTGGGKTARRYQEAARLIDDPGADDLDWLGIHSSRLNGHLLRTIFRSVADPEMITSPERMTPRTAKVLIAAGYRPGHSTDYVATLLAKAYGASHIVNLSNIDYVYDKDPRQFTDAKPLEKISWADFRKMVGDVWTPGSHLPFDPVAAKMAQEMKAKVSVVNGKNLSNLEDLLAGKSYTGTIIG